MSGDRWSDEQVWALIGEIKKAKNLKVLYGTKEGENTSGDTKSTVYNRLAERLDPTRWAADRKKTADRIKHKLGKLETDFKKAVKRLKKTGEGIEEWYQIQATGPDHDTDPVAKNIWQEITKSNPFFEEL
ncbi:hypothetical protein K435DRAFT_696237, partial [Dendrothele bispora CBS 962.96]